MRKVVSKEVTAGGRFDFFLDSALIDNNKKSFSWYWYALLQMMLCKYVQFGGSANSTNLQRLQKLQNRAAGIVTDSPYDAHLEPLTKELDWLTIKQLIYTETVKIVYKALHNEAPDYLKELFHRLSDTQNRELRNSKTDPYIFLLRTCSGQRSSAHRGVCI